MEITKNKNAEVFCIFDDFCQKYEKEIAHTSICEPDGRSVTSKHIDLRIVLRLGYVHAYCNGNL